MRFPGLLTEIQIRSLNLAIALKEGESAKNLWFCIGLYSDQCIEHNPSANTPGLTVAYAPYNIDALESVLQQLGCTT